MVHSLLLCFGQILENNLSAIHHDELQPTIDLLLRRISDNIISLLCDLQIYLASDDILILGYSFDKNNVIPDNFKGAKNRFEYINYTFIILKSLETYVRNLVNGL